MIIYHWHDYAGDTGEDECYAHSLAEARKELRAYLIGGAGPADNMGYGEKGTSITTIEIDRLDIGKIDRAKVIALLYGEGYVEGRTTVEAWRSVPCGKCEECEDATSKEHANGCTAKRVVRVKPKVKL